MPLPGYVLKGASAGSCTICLVRRLCQLGFTLLLMAVFLTPLAELFDTWDPAGLADDTEFRILVLVFALSLILAVCALLVRYALQALRGSPVHHILPERLQPEGWATLVSLFSPPLLPVPLRI